MRLDSGVMVNIRQRVLHATISNYAGRMISLAAWFVLTPLLIRRLGSTEYGLWVLIGSLVAYGWLLNAGIQNAITRYVASCWARGDVGLASRFIATSMWCDVALGLVAITASAVVAPLIPGIFHIPVDDQWTATSLVVLMGLGIGLTIPCETGGAVLRGLQRYDLSNAVDAVGTLLNVGAIAGVLLSGGGLLAVVVVGLPLTILNQVVSVWLSKRIAPGISFGWRSVDLRLVRTLTGFGWPLLLGQTATLLQRKSDEIVIGLFLPVSFVTPYALAHRLSDLCRDMTRQFMGPFLPIASELDAQRDTARLRELFIHGARLSLAIYLPLACTVTALARPILRLWVGDEYSDNVVLVAILSAAGVLLSTEWLATAVLQGMARHRLQGTVAFVSALVNVGVSALLVTRMGLTGVALGTLITASAEYCIVMPYAVRIIGVGVVQCVRRIILPTFVPAVLMMAVLYTAERVGEPTSIVELASMAILGGVVFAVTYLAAGASRSERQLVLKSFAAAASLRAPLWSWAPRIVSKSRAR